jgi:hypothetical protein
MARATLLAGIIACFTGCKVGPEPAGFNCSSDSECEAGLSCYKGIGEPAGGCLFPTIGQCSKPCVVDADCSALTPPPGDQLYSCTQVCDGVDGGTAAYCHAHQ